MREEKLDEKLKTTLLKIGTSEKILESSPKFDGLVKKIDFLKGLGKYQKLIKSLISCNDRKNFNSHVFEALFAYDFETSGHPLIYEFTQDSLNKKGTSVDFCYNLDEERKIYFELRLIYEMNKIKDRMGKEINDEQGFCFSEILIKDVYREEIIKNGNTLYRLPSYGEVPGDNYDGTKTTAKAISLRIQDIILSKCRDKKGNPIKFFEKRDGTYNFIVAEISENFIGMMDKFECRLAMYGPYCVPEHCRLDVFGLCQLIPDNSPAQFIEKYKPYYNKFKHFRETIHGILFVKYDENPFLNLYLDLELEYYFLPNPTLMKENEFDEINNHLKGFLREWTIDTKNIIEGIP
ncbi:MAG: hypothetical protein RDU59_12750 [Thermodesulfobacteriota bacterium]|nr:hypothetical protein [Thermodesulfobacteriota bacterium]